jgi:hypothetical protein
MNAKEAREIAQKIVADKMTDELIYVYGQIEKAVKAGQFEVNLYKCINNTTESRLREDGFTVRSSTDPRGDSDTYISWK